MNLYLISQTAKSGYDTFDSAVVAAPDEDTARNMEPRGLWRGETDPAKNGLPRDWSEDNMFGSWCDRPDQVTVTLLGTAAPTIETPRVLCASFNAG